MQWVMYQREAHEFLTWRRSLYQMAQFFWGTGK